MLSGDNLFVFMLLLQQSALAERHHIKALSHGMISALGMRVALSLAGAALLDRFSWLLLIFAAILMATGLKMLCAGDSPSQAVAGTVDGGSVSAEQAAGSSMARKCIGALVPLWCSNPNPNPSPSPNLNLGPNANPTPQPSPNPSRNPLA